jgi:hypothetical protein
MWQTSKFFDDKFIVKGSWDFSTALNFPKCKYLGADTETKLFHKNKLLSEDEAYRLYKRHLQTYVKRNFEVRAYAFMLSDGDNFALFTNAKDFLTCCAMMHVEVVFWYNARFDFAIFDYYFLTNGWEDVTERLAGQSRYGKLPHGTFQSLNGEFGQRYQLRIWQEYINNRSQRKVHNFKMVDVCNIFGGGLAKNLKDWDIRDKTGAEVRKLEMDYVNGTIEDDIDYMINDTKGLCLLAQKIDETIKDITGYSLIGGDYMTAGGLAKKSLLKFMYRHSDTENKMLFKMCFPLTLDEDTDYRRHNLYLGGKCLVNPSMVGVVQKQIYKYDVNSMYPNQMRNMSYPYGKPKVLKSLPKCREGRCFIMCITHLFGIIRPHMTPVWQDAETGDYIEVIREEEKRYIWLEELEEISKWYSIEYDLEYVLAFDTKTPTGVKKYIDTFYDIKCNRKGAVKNGAKLLLNSAYGKISQRVERELCVYELDNFTGTVKLVKKGIEADEKSMLSVVVGSRITALARVHLMTYIRDICKGDVEHNFIYCDTDSVHALTPYDDCDDKELGKMKCEGVYKYGLYLAPKTYLLYDGAEYEVHCKGVNTGVVASEIAGCKNFSEACDVFNPKRTFKCLSALNVRGGKALIYVDKKIINDENMEINKKALGDLEDVEW